MSQVGIVRRVERRGSVDRLIWVRDLRLLIDALGPGGLEEAAVRAIDVGLARTLGSSLRFARDRLGATVEPALLALLDSARSGPADHYLATGQVGRALRDLGAVPGVRRRASTLARRLFPSRAFLAAKYGEAGNRSSAPRLLLRRLGNFFLFRRGRP